MITTIILAVLALALFFTRSIWKKYLVKAKKNNLNIDLKPFQIPQGLIRNFIIAIEIEEKGDGSAKFEIKKIIK